MLIRPKSASRTRTTHAGFKVSENSKESLSGKEINLKHDSASSSHEGNLEERNTSVMFESKHEIVIGGAASPNSFSLKTESPPKRSISSQDHTGTVNIIDEHYLLF